jgi:hypothetical protein
VLAVLAGSRPLIGMLAAQHHLLRSAGRAVQQLVGLVSIGSIPISPGGVTELHGGGNYGVLVHHGPIAFGSTRLEQGAVGVA